jgi:hypothetical protein
MLDSETKSLSSRPILRAGFSAQQPAGLDSSPHATDGRSILTGLDQIRDFIARVLTQKDFRGAVPALLRAFRAASSESTTWAIANAVIHIGFTKQQWAEVLSLASDPKFGRGRQLLVDVLHRVRLELTNRKVFCSRWSTIPMWMHSRYVP